MKDVESPDVELQCAALKALAFVPVVKMVAHLERARINLPAALVSAHATVRRQACTTMSVLLLERFSSKQVAAFAPLWVAPITRVLWTDADASVLSAAGLFLNQLPSGPLRGELLAKRAFEKANESMLQMPLWPSSQLCRMLCFWSVIAFVC